MYINKVGVSLRGTPFLLYKEKDKLYKEKDKTQ